MSNAPEPVTDEAIDDLRSRLRHTRRVPLIQGTGWQRGADADYLAALARSWAEDYDWRVHERRLLALPWRVTTNGMRLIDQPSGGENAATVVLLHGWPDSFLRYIKVLPLLADLRVIVPCLPGFPYGSPVLEPGLTTGATADLIAQSLDELGVERAVVSGGDVGGFVAESLGARHPHLVSALHLTDLPFMHTVRMPSNADELERRFIDAKQVWLAAEGGYLHEQSTKPHTLAAGLGDSPVGLAAWIVEKLRAWSDCGGDVEAVFPREDLLTWLSLYWFTETIGTSFTPYVEEVQHADAPLSVPTAFTWFTRGLPHEPRQLAERFFNVQIWEDRPMGGHFPSWEQPEAFVNGVRSAVLMGGRSVE